MLYASVAELRADLAAAYALNEGRQIQVRDEADCRNRAAARLAANAALNPDAAVKAAACSEARALAAALGAWPASIQGLYAALGRGELDGLTVPAINVRGLSFEVAGALFEAALAADCGAFIFEIARTEIGYTEQAPAEFAAVILAAAVATGFRGPVFLQGDHVQVRPKPYAADPDAELAAVEALIRAELAAGFYNIDVDTSTLVDLAPPDLDAQQRLNYQLAARLTAFIRRHEPAGVAVSVGGEIGEVGTANSTVAEFDAYMAGYHRELERLAPGALGLSKISVQTGTSHGGVPLPDGRVAAVKLDFGVLEAIGGRARSEYGLSGAVQHGASTLPPALFHRFPASCCSEIHLATGFQNLIFAHPDFPGDLLAAIDAHLRAAHGSERQAGDSDEQFAYKLRKKSWGPFKAQLWGLPAATRASLRAALREQFGFFIAQLGVAGSLDPVHRFIGAAQEAGGRSRG
jgi:hypothetical protein